MVTVRNGNTHAEVTHANGTDFYKYTGSDDIQAGKFTKFLVKANRKLSEAEMNQMASIIGYYWKTIVKGTESLTMTAAGNSAFIMDGRLEDFYGNYVSRSHDPFARFTELVAQLDDLFVKGSKPRKYGDQLVEGLKKDVKVTVWLDAVTQEVESRPVKAAPNPEPVVELPWENNTADYFADKTADNLNFSDVRLLLATFKAEQKKNAVLEGKLAEAQSKLDAIQDVFN
jgi:hypothetical protein